MLWNTCVLISPAHSKTPRATQQQGDVLHCYSCNNTINYKTIFYIFLQHSCLATVYFCHINVICFYDLTFYILLLIVQLVCVIRKSNEGLIILYPNINGLSVCSRMDFFLWKLAILNMGIGVMSFVSFISISFSRSPVPSSQSLFYHFLSDVDYLLYPCHSRSAPSSSCSFHFHSIFREMVIIHSGYMSKPIHLFYFTLV